VPALDGRDTDQPGGKLKRTFAAAIAAVTASTSMWLAATTASAAAPSATLRVVPKWTYQQDGKLAVTAGCSQRSDDRVIDSKLLRQPVRMRKGRNLLIKLTGKTKPGNYTIALLCEGKHQQADSVDVKSVRILKLLGGFWQPDQPGLPAHFKPDVTVSSGPPAPPRPKKKGH
jgi:hypothetical protein